MSKKNKSIESQDLSSDKMSLLDPELRSKRNRKESTEDFSNSIKRPLKQLAAGHSVVQSPQRNNEINLVEGGESSSHQESPIRATSVDFINTQLDNRYNLKSFPHL